MAGDSGPFFAIFPLTAFGPTAALAAFFLGTQAEEVVVVVAATDAAAATPASSTIEAEATGTQAGECSREATVAGTDPIVEAAPAASADADCDCEPPGGEVM
eukprot:GHVU01207591.1.p6 GENE.GHVU01207591.1~~GHVU01207591.1.p6  ORF type:complete len:102 (-),score=18.05 GHVU01207591.1:1212-1517(-)